MGEQVKEARVEKKESRVVIDVNDLQNGIYFVSVKTSEGLFTKKIVVQH